MLPLKPSQFGATLWFLVSSADTSRLLNCANSQCFLQNAASNDGVLGVWSLKALEVVRQEEPEETLSPAKQKLRGVKSSPSNSSETSKKQKKNRVPSLPPLRRAENLSLVDLMPIVSKARRERRGSVGMKIGRNPHKRYDNINGFRNFELDEDEEQEMLRVGTPS